MFGFGKKRLDAAAFGRSLASADMKLLVRGRNQEADRWLMELVDAGADVDQTGPELAAFLSFASWKGVHDEFLAGRLSDLAYAKFLASFTRELDDRILEVFPMDLVTPTLGGNAAVWLDGRIAQYIALCDDFSDLALEVNAVILLCAFLFSVEPDLETKNRLLHFLQQSSSNAADLCRRWKLI